MYEYFNLESGDNQISGFCDDMETALEKVWQSHQWFIRREEKNHVVLWHMLNLILTRTHIDIFLRLDGTATDKAIDRVMRKDA